MPGVTMSYYLEMRDSRKLDSQPKYNGDERFNKIRFST